MLIVKGMMLFCVFSTCFIIGNIISKKYTLRLKELKEFKNALNILESKIKFTYETIPEIFKQISEIFIGNVSKIFRQASESMGILSASEAWDNSLQRVQTNINCEDIENIKNLGKMLGKSDKDGQIKQIELTKTFIDMQIEKASLDEMKNSKMYKTLGTIVGLAFVIILI